LKLGKFNMANTSKPSTVTKKVVKAKINATKTVTKKAVSSKLSVASEVKVADVTTKSVKSSVVKKPTGLTVDVYANDGQVVNSVALPSELFGAHINTQLIAQAVRVYLANQRQGGAKVKTRGEVDGSSKKIFKQKGTGNARHGSIRAPIFVGGGNAFGPVKRDYSLSLPQKMKMRALASVLTQHYQEGGVKILKSFDGVSNKTKAYIDVLNHLSCSGKTLVLVGNDERSVIRMLRNVPTIHTLPAKDVYTYAVLYQKHIVITEAGLAELSHSKGN
jgi:large subunit ribosomal protein L4